MKGWPVILFDLVIDSDVEEMTRHRLRDRAQGFDWVRQQGPSKASCVGGGSADSGGNSS